MRVKKETIIGILIIAAAAALAVAGFILLPATLTVQVNPQRRSHKHHAQGSGTAAPICPQRGFRRSLYERGCPDQNP